MKIQFIIPCHNEKSNIKKLYECLLQSVDKLKYDFEFVFIDDGSDDDSCQAMLDIQSLRIPISIIKLSRNYGKESALKAGIDFVDADAAIILDADMQHPVDLIPAMIREWKNGSIVVDGIKINRGKETYLNKLCSNLFYKVFSFITGFEFRGASDFKLIDRKAIDLLKNIDEVNRFYRGLTNWIGFKHSKVAFVVEERVNGKSKWSFVKLFHLAIDALTSFSSKPLQMVTIMGSFTLIFSIILGMYSLYQRFFGYTVSGFTTVILVIILIASIIMISLGIIGIYIGKIYNEVKRRPNYVVDTIYIDKKKIDRDYGREEKDLLITHAPFLQNKKNSI